MIPVVCCHPWECQFWLVSLFRWPPLYCVLHSHENAGFSLRTHVFVKFTPWCLLPYRICKNAAQTALLRYAPLLYRYGITVNFYVFVSQKHFLLETYESCCALGTASQQRANAHRNYAACLVLLQAFLRIMPGIKAKFPSASRLLSLPVSAFNGTFQRNNCVLFLLFLTVSNTSVLKAYKERKLNAASLPASSASALPTKYHFVNAFATKTSNHFHRPEWYFVTSCVDSPFSCICIDIKPLTGLDTRLLL